MSGAMPGEGGCTVGLEDAQDLVAGDLLDLGDAVRVAQHHADLRRRQALLGEAADVVGDFGRGDLDPAGRRAAVRQRRRRDSLPVGVHAAHLCKVATCVFFSFCSTVF